MFILKLNVTFTQKDWYTDPDGETDLKLVDSCQNEKRFS